MTHTKKQILHIRYSEPEQRGFKQAAKLSGLALSSWVRERLRRMAIKELEAAGKKVPFIDAVDF